MTKITRIDRALCRFSVFRGLFDTPVFRKFFAYAEAEIGSENKLSAYGDLVSEIYEGGGSLAACVRRALFEDENVYVRAIAGGGRISPAIEEATGHELEILSQLASLSPADFAEDMEESDFLPSFESERADLVAEYGERVKSIGRYGYGIFASYGMFAVDNDGHIKPIESADDTSIANFIGYGDERRRVMANTEAFLEGRPAANVLLYGDAGTGKSSTVKAIANHLFDRGLRLIELRKNQLLLLPRVMGEIGRNPLKFIIFIDDLSFNSNDDQFSMLKATLEGSASARAKNAVIYATSNRRHIIKESFSDREGSDVHRNDTVQETLSLSERFGLTVLFAKPEKKLYLEIVTELAARNGIDKDPAELARAAEEFALRRGYRSARCAEQFIHSLM